MNYINYSVVGVEKNDFVTKDGTNVKGFDIYLETQFTGETGTGIKTAKIYLSDAKMKKFGLSELSLVGRHIALRYNRFGKPGDVKVTDSL